MPPKSEESEVIPKPGATVSTVNTILLFCTLGVLGFMGNETYANSKQLAEIRAGQITRPEMEAKLMDLRAEQISQRTKLVELEVMIASIRKP